jgi:hypothetical protein
MARRHQFLKNMVAESYQSSALFPVMSTTDVSPITGVALTFNVKDYGAVGDGVTDDTAAIQTAIDAAAAAGGGDVYFPPGIFVLSSTQVAVGHVRILGAGAGNNFSGDDTPTSTILWDGGAAAMFTSDDHDNSWSFDRIFLDGGGVATYGVHAISMQDQRWGTLHVGGCVTSQVYLQGLNPTPLAFNVFDHLKLNATGTANMLRIDGDNQANCCHNRFGSITGAKAGTGAGVFWADSDNNVVLMTFIFQADAGATTGWDFRVGSVGGGAARGNYVWHMQAANMTARAGTRNSIGWWDRENGQGEPTIEATAILNYSNDLYGVHLPALFINNTDGSVTEFDVAGVGDNNIRGLKTTFYHDVIVNEQLNFAESTGSKISLYAGTGTGYEIGVEGGELRMAAAGDDGITTIRTGGYAGAEAFRVTNKGIAITDGVTAPTTVAGRAFIYVDTADGDLKVKFGDGTVKVIAADT